MDIIVRRIKKRRPPPRGRRVICQVPQKEKKSQPPDGPVYLAEVEHPADRKRCANPLLVSEKGKNQPTEEGEGGGEKGEEKS